MTNDKAVKLLHRIADEQFDGEYGDERREALEMAVRALEQNLVQESGGLVQDLVKDCISRQQAIDEVINLWADKPFGNPTLIEIKGCIEALPSAQPQRKTGKWMPVSDETQTWHYCSECHYQQYEKTKFCPSCGADMRGDSDE